MMLVLVIIAFLSVAQSYASILQTALREFQQLGLELAGTFDLAAGPTPMLTGKTINYMSPSSQYATSLNRQYFIICTALAIMRTGSQVTNNTYLVHPSTPKRRAGPRPSGRLNFGGGPRAHDH